MHKFSIRSMADPKSTLPIQVLCLAVLGALVVLPLLGGWNKSVKKGQDKSAHAPVQMAFQTNDKPYNYETRTPLLGPEPLC